MSRWFEHTVEDAVMQQIGLLILVSVRSQPARAADIAFAKAYRVAHAHDAHLPVAEVAHAARRGREHFNEH